MSTSLQKTKHGGLAKYNPVKGVEKIAVYEAAEKHWARAKDSSRLKLAIRSKLEAQAEFVLWWDTKIQRKQGARTDLKHRNGSVTRLELGDIAERLGTTLMRISRWRKKFNASPNAFETSVSQALARYLKILELEPVDPQLKASDSNDWYTPDRYLEAARTVLGGFDLDPASSAQANENVKATQYFSLDDSGLKREWHGRVWLNPPYGGLSGPFVARLIDQFSARNIAAAMLLVNSNSTDAGWFQPLWDFLLCFTNHRINFISPGGNDSGSTHGSVFVYLGPERESFIREFAQFGAIVERAS